MAVPQNLLDKIKQFEDNLQSYRAGNYNETQARHDFIDPFFKALGWDVNNEDGYAEAYRDVIHEDAIEIEGKKKAPDYSFRVGGQRKFFVEAKKPAVNIRDGFDPAFQLRRYAWSAKLPLSLLTDFEEFAVYDCRIAPKKDDAPSHARIFYCTYKQLTEPYQTFPTHWDFLESLFSKDAILKGAFDRYADKLPNTRGTQAVDEAFLREIERWRTVLAQSIEQNNASLHVRDLNYAVQITIDRIIFLRICEDRGIEDYNRLRKDVDKDGVYKRLLKQFREADERYNSGLFHIVKDNSRDEQARDTLTPMLTIDDGTLREILQSLYYPAPYAFDVFPADILGQVYERFLGKVIVRDSANAVTVEEKPEVRKAGGVYYTPTYIVDYIVNQTVGKALEGKTPTTAAKLKICDPACGSGSFLLGAYSHLLAWHLAWYTANDPTKYATGNNPRLSQDGFGNWRLSTEERRRILTDNLYGVDIDAQAVEVTKLSLLLKMLEGETSQVVNAQSRLLLGRILPDLDTNIKCGNSLIGSDFYADKEISLFEEDEIYRVNVFDWTAAFPAIFDKGGFDCVIGNPPYIQSRSSQIEEKEKQYFYRSFATAEYQVNTYGIFIEKGLSLLKISGTLGYIVPNYWLATNYDSILRQLVFHKFDAQEIVNVYKVFINATVDTLLLFVNRPAKTIYPKTVEIKSITRELKSISARLDALNNRDWQYKENMLVNSETSDTNFSFQTQIILKGNAVIGDFFLLKFGMKPYQVGKGVPPQTRDVLISKQFNSTTQLDESYLPLLRARDVKRYIIGWQSEWIKYGNHLAEPRNINLFTGERILLQRIVSGQKIEGTYTDKPFICNTDIITLKFLDEKLQYSLLYFAGILMSRLCAYYIKSKNVNLDRAAFPKINTNTLSDYPIIKLDMSDVSERKQHDNIVQLVENMLDLTAKLATASPASRTVLKTQTELTDKMLDAEVYKLYGLTPAEIEIVEGAVSG